MLTPRPEMLGSTAGMQGARRYPHVFRPLQIGRCTVRNRILVPAHTLNYGEDNLPSERHVAYHAERARGGVGLIIFEGVRVHPTSLGRALGVIGYDRRCVEPFRRVVEAVHLHGVPLFGQLLHVGRHVEGYFGRTAVWGPSAIPWSPAGPTPHAMTHDEMAELIEGYIVSAGHLRDAGFDGLEIHLGHGHLLQQFLSPLSNRRDDEYGGTEANRLRFPLAVLRAVRGAMGADYPIGIRISADEFESGGLTLTDMQRITPVLVDAARLDFVNVSHSAYVAGPGLATQIADLSFPPAPFRQLTAGIKTVVGDVLIFGVGRFTRLDLAEAALAAGDADMIGMVRAHIADPLLVARAAAGEEVETRPCVGTNQGCIGMIELDRPMTCLMNPVVGREAEWGEGTLRPAERPRRVLVIGGGPAGLEAARVAARRGHQVKLWERSEQLGGQVCLAARIPRFAQFVQLRTFLERQCQMAGVNIRRKREATAEQVLELEPEVVILATGSTPKRPDFPGATRTLSIWDALEEPARLGQRVVLIDADGNWPAVATAEHLVDQGKQVTIVTSQGSYGWRVTNYSMLGVRYRLREKGIKVRTSRLVRSYDGERLRLEDLTSGDEESLEGVSGVVAAYGGVASDELYARLHGRVTELRVVGDALAPRTALEAIYEGHAAGRSL